MGNNILIFSLQLRQKDPPENPKSTTRVIIPPVATMEKHPSNPNPWSLRVGHLASLAGHT
jgi:hypothetical protein